MKAVEAKDVKPRLVSGLKELHLPAMREAFATAADQARQESLSYEHYLLELVNRECEQRRRKRVERILKESRLPVRLGCCLIFMARPLAGRNWQPRWRWLQDSLFRRRSRAAAWPCFAVSHQKDR